MERRRISSFIKQTVFIAILGIGLAGKTVSAKAEQLESDDVRHYSIHSDWSYYLDLRNKNTAQMCSVTVGGKEWNLEQINFMSGTAQDVFDEYPVKNKLLQNCSIDMNEEAYTYAYDGTSKYPGIDSVSIGGRELICGTDYKVYFMQEKGYNISGSAALWTFSGIRYNFFSITPQMINAKTYNTPFAEASELRYALVIEGIGDYVGYCVVPYKIEMPKAVEFLPQEDNELPPVADDEETPPVTEKPVEAEPPKDTPIDKKIGDKDESPAPTEIDKTPINEPVPEENSGTDPLIETQPEEPKPEEPKPEENSTPSKKTKQKINKFKAVTPGITSIKANKKQITILWKKIGNAKGYQLLVSTDKKFKKNVKKTTIKSGSTKKCSIKKLSNGKTYYVKLRGYTKISGKAYYTRWSKIYKKKI